MRTLSMARHPLGAVVLVCLLAVGCRSGEEVPPAESEISQAERSPAVSYRSSEPVSEEIIVAESSASVAGSAAASPDTGGEVPPHPGEGSVVEPDQADAMEEFVITIVDLQGEPVPNLVVNLEYVSGHEGPYTPGDGLTDMEGAATRRACPARYYVLVSDRKMLDYTGATLRNQMVFALNVERDGDNRSTFVWEYPTPGELDRQTADKVTLRFVDEAGAPLAGLWVNMVPESGSPLESRQVVPGYTDADGAVYLIHYQTGRYEMAAIFGVEGDAWKQRSCSYAFALEEELWEYEFVWEPEVL